MKINHDKANVYLKEIEEKTKSVNVKDIKEQMEDIQRLAKEYKDTQDLFESIELTLYNAIEGDHPHKTVYLMEDFYNYFCSNDIYEYFTPDDYFSELIQFIIDKWEETHPKTIVVLHQLYQIN